MSQKTLLATAGFLGLTGVLLDALGAHALHDSLTAQGTPDVWHTAVVYHLIHAVALLALAVAKSPPTGRTPALVRAIGWCWTGGVVCFSGSLYILALGGPHVLGPITPLGGLLLLAGWALVVVMAWRQAPRPPSA